MRTARLLEAHHAVCTPNRYADNTRASATGLKICFLRNTRIYFDADAIMATVARIMEPLTSENSIGDNTRASMSAVIKDDSTFVTAPNTLENSLFVSQEETTSMKADHTSDEDGMCR